MVDVGGAKAREDQAGGEDTVIHVPWLRRVDITRLAVRYGVNSTAPQILRAVEVSGKRGEEEEWRGEVTARGEGSDGVTRIFVLANRDLRVEASIPLFLTQHDPDFPTLLPIQVETYEDRGKYMTEELQGKHAYALPLCRGAAATHSLVKLEGEASILFQVGATLARLHAIPAASWVPETSPGGCGTSCRFLAESLIHISSSVDERYDSVIDEMEKRLSLLESLVAGTRLLPKATVHGSPKMRHVFLEKGKVVHLCEWRYAAQGAAIFDIASAAVDWCCTDAEKTQEKVEVGRLRRLLTGYRSVRGLTPHEMQLLPEAMRGALLCDTILSLLGGNDDDNLNKAEIPEPDALLKGLARLDDAELAEAIIEVCHNLPASDRHLFDIPATVAYLDGAGCSPAMRNVVALGQEAVARKLKPWEGMGEQASLLGVREAFAKLINATADDITTCPSTSYAVSVAAKNIVIRRGAKVVVLAQQMASNVLPWQEACNRTGGKLLVVEGEGGGGEDSWTHALVSAIQEHDVDVVAIPNLHWSDGSLVDLRKVSRACQQKGAKLVLDLTQSLGVLPVDVREIRPAFLCCSVHKWLLCPYGMALMYVSPEYQGDLAKPLEYHERTREGGDLPKWDSEGVMGNAGYPMLSQRNATGLGAGGRPNPVLLPMIHAALEHVVRYQRDDRFGGLCLEWAAPAIQRIESRAKHLGLVTPQRGKGGLGLGGGGGGGVMMTKGGEVITPHITGLRIREGDVRFSNPAAAMEKIQRYLRDSGIYTAHRIRALRVSVGIWNDWGDVERFCLALEEAVERASEGWEGEGGGGFDPGRRSVDGTDEAGNEEEKRGGFWASIFGS